VDPERASCKGLKELIRSSEELVFQGYADGNIHNVQSSQISFHTCLMMRPASRLLGMALSNLLQV
jgi:hypothetical protein